MVLGVKAECYGLGPLGRENGMCVCCVDEETSSLGGKGDK